MGLLENKIAIITGGGRGIGKAIAHQYSEEGATVIIAEFDEMVLETDWVINDAEIEWESLKRTADFCPNSVEINGVDLTTIVHF